jgi:hypothetical protein
MEVRLHAFNFCHFIPWKRKPFAQWFEVWLDSKVWMDILSKETKTSRQGIKPDSAVDQFLV